ncbi:hypothetical protein AAC387_Pa02g4957 [Persea americana]
MLFEKMLVRRACHGLLSHDRWARRVCSSLAPSTLSQSLPPQNSSTHLIILLLCQKGQLQEALSLFYSLKSHPLLSQTYAALLHSCARHGAPREGRALHSHMLACNHKPDLFLSNHLINMYAKCGCMETALNLFDKMPQRNLVSWTTLITGYDQVGRPNDCFRLFTRLLSYHVPNEFALASVLTSCASCGNINRGRQVHALALKTSFDAYVYVGNALISMYSNCCSDDAWSVFQSMTLRNLITWNSMISGFQLLGLTGCSMSLFVRMHGDGIGFDRATLISVIGSCCESVHSSIGQCRLLHSLAIKAGFVSQPEVATALVKLYATLVSDMDECYRVFIETTDRDIVSWTGIITACAESQPEEALLLFSRLRYHGLNPDRYTFSIVIKACAGLATERHGSALHGLIIRTGFEDDTVLANALMHAYSRCGNIELSEHVFNQMRACDIVSWNTMIKAYAMHGQGEEALRVFAAMDVQPDSTTFVSLLCACAHAGLVDQGHELFNAMLERYGIAPRCDHFACMVDILGRAGRLTEAEDLIKQMPVQGDPVVWSALLSACRKHGETEIAERAAQKLIELEPKNSVGYVMMSNIYCENGRYSDAGFIRKEMKDGRTRKVPGLSWIEIGDLVHEFAAGGRRHPEKDAIYAELNGLVGRLKEMGYVPETSLVLHEIEEQHKEEQLYHHSEKLALAFWLMNATATTSFGCVKIMKNIRICLDCHNFMKVASACIGKKIVVRDANRFHHFRDGVCSCSDYW